MFANTTHVGFAQRVVATLVAGAVLLWSVGAFGTAQAANLTNISDTLSTSEPSVTAAHTIAFTVPTGSSISNADTVTITFPTGAGEFAGVATVASGDVSITVGGTGTTTSGFTAAASSISFDTLTVAAGQEVVVAIADGKITNPSNLGSHEITVDTGTGGDTGKTRVAIINTVLVTAIVPTSFDFSITGLATSTAVNGTSTTGSTTATLVPFGVLQAGGIKTLAQLLTVSTNAINGFVVTVETDGDLRSSTGAIIDTFNDGNDVSTAGTSWVSPSNNILDDTTWGHWGITYEDDATEDLAANEFIAASTTPREVFSHTGPADGTTTNIGTTSVGYQVEITPLQEAADDYSTTLTYIATPTF